MADLDTLLERLAPMMADPKVRLIAEELRALSAQSLPWKKTVINLTLDAVDKFGIAGVTYALDAVYALKNNQTPKIDWANLEVASDLLAMQENAEADQKSASYVFLVKFTNLLIPLLKILLSALL